MTSSGLQSRLLCGLVLLLFGGCQIVESRSRSLFYFSATSAGYAGRFRIAHGRWPADSAELERFMCAAGQAEAFGLVRPDCAEAASLPYRLELVPLGADLRIRYLEDSGDAVCTLRLLAPPADGAAISPMIVIKSSLLACRGGAFEQARVIRE